MLSSQYWSSVLGFGIHGVRWRMLGRQHGLKIHNRINNWSGSTWHCSVVMEDQRRWGITGIGGHLSVQGLKDEIKRFWDNDCKQNLMNTRKLSRVSFTRKQRMVSGWVRRTRISKTEGIHGKSLLRGLSDLLHSLLPTKEIWQLSLHALFFWKFHCKWPNFI